MRFEELVSRLPGVLALRTVDDGGVVVEVHVLVAPGRDQEEVARSIRSVALVSDLELDPARINVVQLDADEEPIERLGGDPAVAAEAEDAEEPEAVAARPVDIDLVAPAPPPPPVPTASPSTLRARLLDVEVRVVDGVGHATVELEVGTSIHRGSAGFAPTTPTERRAVAEAALRAVTAAVGWEGAVAVDTAVVIAMPNLDVALVTLAAVSGEERTLVGAAAVLDGGVHEALARATLDATNRAVARRPSST